MASDARNRPTRFDVTSFGESMVRLSVPAGRRLRDARSFDAILGGAESNVCIALAGLGRRTSWFSALPESGMGDWALRQLTVQGLDVSGVVRSPGTRLGAYYVELAATPNPIGVIYDRAGSAAAEVAPADIDLDQLLDTQWVHLTGITPALGPGPREIVDAILDRASAAGARVSLDVNFRAKLWQPEEARDWVQPRLSAVDLLICGRADADVVLEREGQPEDVVRGLAKETRSGMAVLTLGEHGAVASQDDQLCRVQAIEAHVVDRLGAGDAFAAGVLDGLLDGSIEDGLSRGRVLAAMALAQHGDHVSVTRAELERVEAEAHHRPDR